MWKDVISTAADQGSGSGPNWAPTPAFAAALGRALGRGDRHGASYSVADLLAGSGGGGGSSASGDGRRDGGTPPFTRDAARGALVFAGVEAVETGDILALTELGVDLTSLAGLTGRELIIRLMDLILGGPAHPEDRALRQAVFATLTSAPPGMTLRDRIVAFVSALAWERTSVQLASAAERGASDSSNNSNKIKNWITAKVERISDVLTAATPGALANFASKIAAQATVLFGKKDQS